MSLGVVEKSAETWRLAVEEIVEYYAVDESLVIDPSQPISHYETGVYEIEIVAPTASSIPFTAPELLGTWSVSGISSDDPTLADHCITRIDLPCSDLLRFNADGTAFLEQSGRSTTWTINSLGELELLFVDNGTQLTISRLHKGDHISTALLHFEGVDKYLADVDIMIKRSIPAPNSLDGLYGKFMTNGFQLTADIERRSSLDNGFIDSFGFIVNADGTSSRNYISSDITEQSGVPIVEGYIYTEPRSWQIENGVLTHEWCRDFNADDICDRLYQRFWYLLQVTDTRVLVHERLYWRQDFNADGVFDEEEVILDRLRPNFYQVLPYYDIKDVDRDGIPNEQDIFVTDELEWADANGNGIGDNQDPDFDIDGDGILNGVDEDDDNDGLSDTEEAALGTLPFIADTDGDGISDRDEVNSGSDPLDAGSLPIEDEDVHRMPLWMLIRAADLLPDGQVIR